MFPGAGRRCRPYEQGGSSLLSLASCQRCPRSIQGGLIDI